MNKILAVYGSPRREGNTTLLLNQALQGALDTGAQVEKIVLGDLQMSPCLEIYGCKETGRCVIQDDFQEVYDQLLACHGVIAGLAHLLLYGECPYKDLDGPLPIPLG